MKYDHIIIPDAHAKPGVSNERFSWLGKYVLDFLKKKPETHIIELGDWEDMPSLSSYDLGKKSYEGRRYRKDLEAAWEARELFIKPLREFNNQRKKNKEKQIKPSLYSLGGNHFEGRIKRVINLSPMLEGTISTEDNRCKEFGWEYIPFLDPLFLDGIAYSHYFTSGVMGKAIGGEHPGYSLITKQHHTCIQGHSHLFDMTTRVKPDGSRIWGIHAGCYMSHDEDYAGPANKMWKRGILVLKNVSKGDFEDFEWISIQTLKDRYE